MTRKALKVRRSVIATDKLEEIYEYSCEHWGKGVALKYMRDIETVIQEAAIEWGGRKRNVDYSKRFTYSVAKRHLIFFDVRKDTLFVATVIHCSMEIKDRLAEEMVTIQCETAEG